ncbi:MAG: hypothetical protein ACXAD7_24285 [Candidatus Kariarchaeaceae archaeon]
MSKKLYGMISIILLVGTIVSAVVLLNIRQSNDEYWPTDKWKSSAPEKQDMDAEILNKAATYLDENTPRLDLLVVRNGYIVLERSWIKGVVTYNMLSATKSFASTLIGIAIKEGFIESVNQ